MDLRILVNESVATWILATIRCVPLVSVLVFHVTKLPAPEVNVPIRRRSEYRVTDGYVKPLPMVS